MFILNLAQVDQIGDLIMRKSGNPCGFEISPSFKKIKQGFNLYRYIIFSYI